MTILHDVPNGIVMPAANCARNFDSICTALAAIPAEECITYSKKLAKPARRYRTVGIKLNNGRFATLLAIDGETNFQVCLQRKGYGFYLSEIEEVRLFVTAEKSEITRLDNDLKWIQPEDGRRIELPIMTVPRID